MRKTKAGAGSPVAGLAAGGDELVGIEDHDLVLVGLVDQDAVDRRGVGGQDGESVADQPEHALHSLLSMAPNRI